MRSEWLVTVFFALLCPSSAGSDKKKDPPRTQLANSCSRSISRNVKRQLDKEIIQPATRAGHVKWQLACPFDPSRALFNTHEKAKTRRSPNGHGGGSAWTCGMCNKTFANEHYLDLHLERKHGGIAPSESVCLADYCEMFEVCYEDRRRRVRYGDDENCDAEQLAKSRHLCEDALLRCFPLAESTTRILHAQLSKQWCQVLDCAIRAERRKDLEEDRVPVAVLMILIVLVCTVVFAVVVCCVDSSDDIVMFLKEAGLLSREGARNLLKAKEQTQKKAGFVDRTKSI
jgi:hypothetical protein